MNEQFMREAIRLSVAMMRRGKGGPFGAVVVCGDRVVGHGWNAVTSRNDPTAHAEVMAIRQACRNLNRFHLEDCEIYTSCEPCPMCLAAIYWARLRKGYYANTRKDAARIGFNDALIYQEVARPKSKRKLRMAPLLRDEALKAFAEWESKADKLRY